MNEQREMNWLLRLVLWCKQSEIVWFVIGLSYFAISSLTFPLWVWFAKPKYGEIHKA